MHLSLAPLLHLSWLATLLIPLLSLSTASELPVAPSSIHLTEPGSASDPHSSHPLPLHYDLQEEEPPALVRPKPNRDEEEVAESPEPGNADLKLAKRAPIAILNNTPQQGGLRIDQTINYEFSNTVSPRGFDRDALDGEEDGSWDHSDAGGQELRKRQNPGSRRRTVYISINTCNQPDYSSKVDQEDPPQLTLYLSHSGKHQEPGPTTNGDDIISTPLVEGFASVAVDTTNNVYIGVSSPKVDVVKNGIWTYFVAASVDAPYHSYINSSLNLFMIDSDRNAALLITKNLSSAAPNKKNVDEWLDLGPPLSIFVQETNNTAISGLRRSYCGLATRAMLPGPGIDPIAVGMETGLTKYGGSSLEQQFYIPNLNATSTYFGILARPSATVDSPGGGGAVYASMNFSTKLQANCRVIYNLTFCSSIAYAVPANPATFADVSALSALYDSTTAEKYQNFNYSLQQIPCNTTATAQYSLNKTCDDCALAYKKWLCAVSIPRCADWVPNPDAAGMAFLQPRNAAQDPIAATPEIAPVTNATLLAWLATNSSRNNATIAGHIRPGPYSEILPCEDLCYEIVRACPAAFGFGCPYKGHGLESGYGVRNLNINGGVSCSEPGAVFGLSAGASLSGCVWAVLACAALVSVVVMGGDGVVL